MMKKLLFALMIALCFSVPAWADYNYDVNGDGDVSADDISLLIDYLLTGSATGIGNADLNDDGLVDVKDITILIDYMVSKPRKLNGHEYIKIGGKRWATMNIGATSVAGNDAVETPSYIAGFTYCATNRSVYSCFGTYFKWGETSAPVTPCNDSNIPPLNSCDDPTLCAEHDAATVNWGAPWRTPTKDDFLALFVACGGTGEELANPPALTASNLNSKGIYWCAAGQTVATEYQAAGILFVQDAEHKLFFPVAGYIRGSNLDSPGYEGWCWTSTLHTYNTEACDIYMRESGVYMSDRSARCYAFPVRPVAD